MESNIELSEIQHFYKNKIILLTGATSFVGELLLERILRLLPVKQVYVIIRKKADVDAASRCSSLLESQVLFSTKLHVNIDPV